MILIQESFTQEEAKKAGGAICVTPQSFSRVQSWKGIKVSGLEYYVKKAVALGAICKDVDGDGLKDKDPELEKARDIATSLGMSGFGRLGLEKLNAAIEAKKAELA